MVLHPVPMPPEPPPNVTVAPGLEPGLADFLPWSFATDPDVRVFTSRLDGRPVGTSIAIRTGDVAGVYGVGTIPSARRRGVGTAASWAAVAAGRAWNCDAIVLRATEMGLPSYEQMGVPYGRALHHVQQRRRLVRVFLQHREEAGRRRSPGLGNRLAPRHEADIRGRSDPETYTIGVQIRA
jgi:GNAT superfamily N-acetyltransferase